MPPELKSPGSDISEFATALTATLNAAAATGQASLSVTALTPLPASRAASGERDIVKLR